MSSQHVRTPTSTTSFHNHHYRSFHYPSASSASTYSREPVSPLLPADHFRPTSPPRTALAYNDAYDLTSASPFVSPIMSRTPSVAGSDRYSTISGVTGYWPQNPDNVSPAAAYVAPFGAVQVVNEHHANARGRRSSNASDDEDDRNASRKSDAQFSPQALNLVNHFLDQLLYSFLSTARSTNLHALRPAVTEVLRHRLAKEAVANADEELQELLAGGEEEEERNALTQVSSKDRKWDLELVWKRTRLRVMVYMRLGEMEDDDEERFVKEQELFYGREADSRRFSSSSGLVSWSAAIFLTSVLEYVAEQSLQAAGTVAYARARRSSIAKPSSTTSNPTRVEDYDVEKLALDARLGRLWRTWRKTLRNDRQRPTTPNHRYMASKSSFTRDRALSLSALRGGSSGHSREESLAAEEQYRAIRQQQYLQGVSGPGYDDPETDFPEHVLASNIPLPMRDDDVDEIEVPGLAKSTDEDTEEDARRRRARRNSYTSPMSEIVNSYSQPQAEQKSYFPTGSAKPSIARQRSKSVPYPYQARTPNLEIPGAFPAMPEEQRVRTTNVEQDPMHEPKASAVDMYDHKQNREGSKVLRDAGIMPRMVQPSDQMLADDKAADESVRNVPEVDTQAADDEQPKVADVPNDNEDQHLGLLAGVAAGATAVAGTALAAVGIEDHLGEEKSRNEDIAQSHNDPVEGSDSALPRPRERSSQEIRDLDNRKSLVDLKAIMAAESAPRSREGYRPRVPRSASPVDDQMESMPIENKALKEDLSSSRGLESAEPDASRVVVTVPASVHQDPLLDHKGSTTTDQSYSLGHQEPAQENEDSVVLAGVADEEALPPSPKTLRENGHSRHDTETMAALEAPAPPSETFQDHEVEPKTRDMPMIGSPKALEKPGRLIITGDPLAQPSKPSPIAVHAEQAKQSPKSPKSPREFLRSRNLSLDSEAPPPFSKEHAVQSPNEQTRAIAPRPATVGSLPATPTSADKENKARESKTIPSDLEQHKNGSPQSRNLYSAHQKQNSRGEVQDHPAIQSMATPKKETTMVAAPVNGTNTPPVVTSSNIRGPEDFDNFLQGDDTVKYTLTPETVRDERSGLPTSESKPVMKQISHPASLARLSGQAGEGASTDASNSPQRKNSSPAPNSQRQSRAGRSQSIKDITAVASEQDRDAACERRRSISKPPPRNTSVGRRSGLMAREPQVMTASTRDFADFIRSTGPDREQDVKRLNTNRSTTSLQSLRNTARSQSVGASSVGSGRERTKSLTQTTMAAENIPPVPRMPTGEGMKSSGSRGPPLQARSATGAASGNKDLINFIRDGPDEQGSHRISRSVAPFRNTMDSDQFDMADVLAATVPSKPDSEVNGTGGLHLRNSSNTPAQSTPAHRPSPSNGSAPRSAPLTEPEGDVTRKRYRNKDPYAIPSDSEDEEDEADFLTALPRKNQRPKEESLVDFLRNNEPPTNNAPRPISGAGLAAANLNKPRTPTTPQSPPGSEPSVPAQRKKSMQSQNGPQAVPQNQSFSPPNTNSTPRTAGSKLEARGAGTPRQAIPRGNAGARLGAYQQTNTGDLADFLRSSGPAEEPVVPSFAPKAQELIEPPKKKKGFFSRFSSKK